jgi:hypothetical protein
MEMARICSFEKPDGYQSFSELKSIPRTDLKAVSIGNAEENQGCYTTAGDGKLVHFKEHMLQQLRNIPPMLSIASNNCTRQWVQGPINRA